MKLRSLILTSVLMTASLANASCYNVYQEKLTDVKATIKNSNVDRAMKEALVLATSTNVIVIAALAGSGGPLVSTYAGTGMVASIIFAQKYIEWRTTDSIEEAMAKKQLIESSLALLKEAKLGQGPLLQQAIAVINQNVSTAISMKDLAEKITEQNEARQYCQNTDQIHAPAGILELAINELKQEI